MKQNPIQILQFIKASGNPQKFMLNMLQQQSNNPIMANLMQMAQANDEKGIENFARNLMKEQGLDFDKDFNTFKKNLGI